MCWFSQGVIDSSKMLGQRYWRKCIDHHSTGMNYGHGGKGRFMLSSAIEQKWPMCCPGLWDWDNFIILCTPWGWDNTLLCVSTNVVSKDLPHTFPPNFPQPSWSGSSLVFPNCLQGMWEWLGSSTWVTLLLVVRHDAVASHENGWPQASSNNVHLSKASSKTHRVAKVLCDKRTSDCNLLTNV